MATHMDYLLAIYYYLVNISKSNISNISKMCNFLDNF